MRRSRRISNFWALFVVLAAVLVAAWFLPRNASRGALRRSRPKAPAIPRRLRNVFATSATAAASGFALGALMSSLGAQIARDLIGSGNVLVNGAAMASFAAFVSAVATLAKRLPAATAVGFGGVASAIAMALLALSTTHHALAIFLAAVAFAGAAYSLLFVGGLALISAAAPAGRRGGMLSALYLVAYLMQVVVALLLGAAASAWGLATAIELGSTAIALLGLTASGLAASINGRWTGARP